MSIDEETGVRDYISDIKRIAAGERFVLSLRNDGLLYAWGDNTSGQLGVEINNEITEDGTAIEDSRSLPVEVDLTDGVDFTEITDIAAGKNHTVIVLNNDTVYTWGDNTYGQLGTGENGSYIPNQVKGFNGGGYLTDIISVKAGSYHTVALKRDGSVWAWGRNDRGQLGDMTTEDREYPIQVFKGDSYGNGYYLENISQISAKANNTAVIDRNSRVYAWGDNTSQQLGDYTLSADYASTPRKVYTTYQYDPNYELTNVMAISVGFEHMLSIDYDGNVAIWGKVIDDNGAFTVYDRANGVVAGETGTVQV